MSRRHRAEKREIIPDAKFGDQVVSKFMNSIMHAGKKSVSEGIVYGALDQVEQKAREDPHRVFHQALVNVMPSIAKVVHDRMANQLVTAQIVRRIKIG